MKGVQSRIGRIRNMKSIVWMVGGACAAVAGFLVWGPKRVKPVQELAHRLEEAWADHNTTV
jgi:hypothetical protein